GLRVAAEVGELDGLPLFRGQAANSLAHRQTLERQGNLVPRIRTYAGFDQLGLQLQLLALVGAASSQVVDGAIADGRDQPGSQGTFLGIERCGVGPDLQDRLLNHVLSTAGIPEHTQGDGVRQPRISVVQLQQRILVARRQDDRELRIRESFGGYWLMNRPVRSMRLRRASGESSAPRSATSS